MIEFPVTLDLTYQEDVEWRGPRHQPHEEPGQEDAGGQEGQLLPRPRDQRPEHSPRDQGGHAAPQGPQGPDEVDPWQMFLVEFYVEWLLTLTNAPGHWNGYHEGKVWLGGTKDAHC